MFLLVSSLTYLLLYNKYSIVENVEENIAENSGENTEENIESID